ncbi:GFA family protein [Porticoccaceae bacterium LTM1]|nr:GFA family protein [Porticoccaceae bacterium LTM1]
MFFAKRWFDRVGDGLDLFLEKHIMHKGSCLCGKITFEIAGDLGENDACHCVNCRKWSGHFLVSANVPRSALNVSGAEYITWYQSSLKVRRGFCSVCGSSLFFDPLDTEKHNWTGIALGALDTPTNTSLEKHIFVAEKGCNPPIYNRAF